jgi:predicted ATPase
MDDPFETEQTTYNTDDLVFDLTEEGSVEVDYVRTNVVEVDEEQTTDRQPWDDIDFPF